MKSWVCARCQVRNASTAPKCRRCLRRREGATTLGDLVDRWLMTYDKRRRVDRATAKKEKG